MVGTKYLKYFPNVIKLKTGLTLYESAFISHDGTRGVVGGPHRSFTQTGKQFQETHFGLGAYFTDEAEQYWKEFTVNLSVPLLDNRDACMMDTCNGDYHQSTESFMARRPPKNNKMYEEVENAGTEVTYRCVECRNCSECKRNGQIESISLQEEVERSIIGRSVDVNIQKG